MATIFSRPLAVVTVGAFASLTSADILFQDSFESGLGQWNGNWGGSKNGLLIADPFDSSNTVLSFTDTEIFGDTYTPTLNLTLDTTYQVSFDYLGLHLSDHSYSSSGAYNSNTGGSVGFASSGFRGKSWHWGTDDHYGHSEVLVEDGQWHSYSFDFTAADLGGETSVRLFLQDLTAAGPIGDAFFDNISIRTAPSVPGSGVPAALALATCGLCVMRRRR